MKTLTTRARIVCLALLLVLGVGCRGADASRAITVISREDGSGTRGAFVELFGIEERGEDGILIDRTTRYAEITNNTAVMMTSVIGDKNAIGYLSLGSMNEAVKALRIDGAAPSIESVRDESYTVWRPFQIATKGAPSALSENFIQFILSEQGQAVVEAKGYVPLEGAEPFAGGDMSGKLVIAGSSSVAPVMESLREAYLAINGRAQIEIQQSDSSTGATATIDGICDIGMLSRNLKESEVAAGLQSTVIARDGIVVIVNRNNPVDDLTIEQVREIFRGDLTSWTDVA